MRRRRKDSRQTASESFTVLEQTLKKGESENLFYKQWSKLKCHTLLIDAGWCHNEQLFLLVLCVCECVFVWLPKAPFPPLDVKQCALVREDRAALETRSPPKTHKRTNTQTVPLHTPKNSRTSSLCHSIPNKAKDGHSNSNCFYNGGSLVERF